jgi:hypothetical protein
VKEVDLVNAIQWRTDNMTEFFAALDAVTSRLKPMQAIDIHVSDWLTTNSVGHIKIYTDKEWKEHGFRQGD